MVMGTTWSPASARTWREQVVDSVGASSVSAHVSGPSGLVADRFDTVLVPVFDTGIDTVVVVPTGTSAVPAPPAALPPTLGVPEVRSQEQPLSGVPLPGSPGTPPPVARPVANSSAEPVTLPPGVDAVARIGALWLPAPGVHDPVHVVDASTASVVLPHVILPPGPETARSVRVTLPVLETGTAIVAARSAGTWAVPGAPAVRPLTVGVPIVRLHAQPSAGRGAASDAVSATVAGAGSDVAARSESEVLSEGALPSVASSTGWIV